MRYLSLFSGIEAASVAWKDFGWTPVAFSEIAPFQCEVLKHHYPSVLNLGDITKIDWSEYAGTVDIIIGGSPCQSFSLAGTRTGLSGPSGLMYEYIRAIREVRPRYFIWENVIGAFTSEHGAAFRQLLQQLDECGYSMAWRVLDSIYFGSAQSRRRVFVVGHSGDHRAPGTILFEPETVFKHYSASSSKRANLTPSTTRDFNCWSQHGATINRIHPYAGPRGTGTHFEYIGTITALYSKDAIIIGSEDKNKRQARFFTPVELERLFGFPDNYTNVIFNGKPPTYEMRKECLGNSFVVPVIKWIGQRLKATDEFLYSKGD